MTENQTKELKIVDKRASFNEIQTMPTAPTDVIMAAIQKGYTPEFIERMMSLQERFEANEARKAYTKSMSKFKANPPEILKTKHVSYKNSKGQIVEWDHAVLGEITEAIIKGLSEYGFYHRWDTTQPDKLKVVTTCIITHELGHSESTSMSGPPDTSGGKDDLKAVSSTNTLLQRLTLLALTGLAAKGIDNESPGDYKIGLLEQWEIKLDEAGAAAKVSDEIATWWKSNSPQIKKELTKADAAKIYEKVKVYSKKLSVPERESGSDNA